MTKNKKGVIQSKSLLIEGLIFPLMPTQRACLQYHFRMLRGSILTCLVFTSKIICGENMKDNHQARID